MTIQSSSATDQWSFRRVVWATLVLVFVIFSFWFMYRFYKVLFILFIAIVFGTVIRPLITWTTKRGLHRNLAMLIVFIFMLVLLVGFIVLLVPLIINQGSTILTAVPGYYQGLRQWAANSSNQLIIRLNEFLPATFTFSGLQPGLQTGQQVLASAEQALSYLLIAVKVIFVAICLILLAYHWTLDGSQKTQALLLFLPKMRRENISGLITSMETKVGLFVLGQTFLCLVIGVMALIVYLIIGLPNALVLALVAAVMEAVPMLGPFLGAIPASVIALSISPLKLVWVVVGTVIIQQLENNLLVPRVMRKAVGVNPFVSLLAIFAFSSMFGIAGALMAIPIAAIIQILLDRFVFQKVEIEQEQSAGRDETSRLRYEAQDLAQDLRKQARYTKMGTDLNIKQIDQVMDEIETITIDLDALLAQVPSQGDE